MKEIKLIAFDLDGTFLKDDKSIPDENLKAISFAASKGAVIVPATGRLYKGIPEKIKALPFIRYYILINGGEIYDAKENANIIRREIPAELALEVYDYADTIDCLYDCYMDDTGKMSRDMYGKMEDYFPDHNYLKEMIRLREPVDSLPDYIRATGKSLQKIQLYFKDPGEREYQIAKMKEVFPDLIFSTSLASNIEINHKSAGKGKALEALCTALGISIENAAAFGDGTNDLEMIETAGTGIAMDNAADSVKAAANLIAGNNNDAGVAEMIYRILK